MAKLTIPAQRGYWGTHHPAGKRRLTGALELKEYQLRSFDVESTALSLAKDGQSALVGRIRRLLDRWQPPETGVLIATAVIVGLGGAGGGRLSLADQ